MKIKTLSEKGNRTSIQIELSIREAILICNNHTNVTKFALHDLKKELVGYNKDLD